MNTQQTILPLSIVILGIVFLIFLNNAATETIQQQSQVIDSLQTDLDYYESNYHFRVDTIYDEYGNPETIRAISIDGGKNWLIITQHREVKQSRYLRIKYPDIDPDSLKKIY